MDGTREFIEERYHNCQCLIGVAHKGKAVVGVVGIPFPKRENNQERATWKACAVVYGMCYENEDGKNVMKVLETCNEELLGRATTATTEQQHQDQRQQKKQRVSSETTTSTSSYILATGDSKSKALRTGGGENHRMHKRGLMLSQTRWST